MTDQRDDIPPPRRVLVTGATGRTGRHVVDGLLNAGVRVTALVRNPDSAGFCDRVHVVQGDLEQPDTVAAAAEGTDAAFLLWPGFSSDGAAEVVDALARATPHIVYLSAAQLQHGEGVNDGVWADVEALIRDSGAEWTFVRGGGFAVNTLGWAEDIGTGNDVVRIPVPGAGRSLVHERDLADVIVRALTDRSLRGRAFALTGPQTLTQIEQVRAIGAALGRDLRVEEQPREEAQREMEAAGFGEFATASLDYWDSLVDDPEGVTHDVEEVTGHPARTFAEWALDHAPDFGAPTTADVAWDYANAFRRGDVDAAWALLADDVVRIAPFETGGRLDEVRGLDAIAANAERLNSEIELLGVDIGDPMVHGREFAIRFSFEEVPVPTGRRQTTTKLSHCTVEGGRIAREEVFYFTPAHAPDAEVVA